MVGPQGACAGALITTGPFNPDTFMPGVTPPPGALSSPGTAILFGGQDVSLGTFSGLRLQGGVDLTDDRSLAVEGGGFLLEQRARSFTASSNAAGVPFLAIPVIDSVTGRETSVAASFADDSANLFGGLSGGIAAETTTRLWARKPTSLRWSCAETRSGRRPWPAFATCR